MLRFFCNSSQKVCRNICSIFFFSFFSLSFISSNTIKSFLFFSTMSLSFSFFRFIHHFDSILFCHFCLRSSLFCQHFNRFFSLFRISRDFSSWSQQQQKWCLLSVTFHMLTMTSNYQFNYLKIFSSFNCTLYTQTDWNQFLLIDYMIIQLIVVIVAIRIRNLK